MAVLSPEEQTGLQPAGGVLPSGAAAAVGRSTTSGAGATAAPPKASASTSKTLVTGLADALNRTQDELKAQGIIEYPDRYYFELDSLLEQTKVVPPGSTDKRQTPMGATGTAQDKLDQKTQAVDTNARKFSIVAGTSILQFLDQVVRNTDYIYEQQIKYYDPKTKQLVENGNPADITGWYRIGMQVAPRLGEYDRKRNDYAYDITYRVEVYAINDTKSDFFPSAQYRGSHKRYDYWFTGINTQILDYQQDFNYLYTYTQNANSPPRTKSETGNWREVPRYFFAPRSPQSDQMNEGPVSEPSAQLADYLYSPGDTAKIKLKILGDPAWIQQGDIRGGLIRGSGLYDAFLPDGTINYAGQQVLFEVLWNKPQDYDLSTGLMDVGKNNYGADRLASRAGDAVQTYVYNATQCTSTFSRGQFTQELEGSQVLFNLPRKRQVETREETKAQAQKSASSTRKSNVPNKGPGKAAPSGSLWDAEGWGQALGAESAETTTATPKSSARGLFTPQSPRDARPAEPATSSTQTVGVPNETAAETNRLLGTARGSAVGAPSATLYLNDGSTVEVKSQSQINALRQGGFASPQAASAATSRLNLAQQAANSPNTAVRPQLIAKDN